MRCPLAYQLLHPNAAWVLALSSKPQETLLFAQVTLNISHKGSICSKRSQLESTSQLLLQLQIFLWLCQKSTSMTGQVSLITQSNWWSICKGKTQILEIRLILQEATSLLSLPPLLPPYRYFTPPKCHSASSCFGKQELRNICPSTAGMKPWGRVRKDKI